MAILEAFGKYVCVNRVQLMQLTCLLTKLLHEAESFLRS